MNKGVFALVAFAFFIGIVSASFNVNNDTIKTSYLPGENASGILNITLTDEKLDGYLTSNFGGSILLYDLIKLNELERGVSYTCSAADCGRKYSTTGDNLANSFSIDGKSTIGFYLQGKAISITSIDLNIQSLAPPSCKEQMTLDYLDLGEKMIYNNKYFVSTCGEKDYGCFDASASNPEDDVIIQPGDTLCEKMELEYAPAYVTGANIINSANGKGSLSMRLYDEEGQFVSQCALSAINRSVEEVGCVMEHVFREPKQYYICVSSTGGEYKIRSEKSGELCGSNNLDEGIGSYDYEIYVQKLKYDSFNTSVKKEFDLKYDDDFKQYTNDYLINKYGIGTKEGTANCVKGCIIPITIDAGNLSQDINFSARRVLYKDEGNTRDTNKMYYLTKEESLISGTRIPLDISFAGFPLNNPGKNLKFILNYRGSSVITKNVNVTPPLEFDVSPKFAYPGIRTKFVAASPNPASKTIWNIEGLDKENNLPEIEYTFDDKGDYPIYVTYVDTNGNSVSKNFTIMVANVSEALARVLNESSQRVNSLLSSLEILPPSMADALSKMLNISAKKEILDLMNAKKGQNITEEEMILYINRLNSLKLPARIDYDSVAEIPFVIGLQNVDISLLAAFSDVKISREEIQNYTDNLIYFENNNFFNSKVESQVVKIEDESGAGENAATYFGIDLIDSGIVRNNTYLFINYPKSQIHFIGDYPIDEISLGEERSAVAINIKNINSISFFLDGEQSFENLGIFVAEPINPKAIYIAPNLPTKTLIIYICVLVFGFFIVYITLQEWYKKRYQKYLFRSNDDLYNLFSFIFNSRASGMNDEITKSRLRGFGWNGEQLTYSFKKIDGKRTGMWEIPIFRYFEQRKIRKEIEKRRALGQNARFIKRVGM